MCLEMSAGITGSDPDMDRGVVTGATGMAQPS